MIRRVVWMACLIGMGCGGPTQEVVDCNTRASALTGKPGSSHLVVCPADCTAGPLWGSVIYSDDSAICSAAIHAGYLKADGGSVGMYVRGYQARFLGSQRNGLRSSAYGPWSRSFSFIKPEDVRGKTWRWWGLVRNWSLVLLIALGFVLVYRWRRGQVRKVAAAIKALAESLGLELDPPAAGQAGNAHGRFEGFEVSVRTYTSGSAHRGSSTTYILVETTLARAVLEGVRIFPRNILHQVTAALDRLGGEQELLTGNKQFDEAFYAGSADESKRGLLNSEVQAALLEYVAAGSDWELWLGGNQIKATRTIRPVLTAELEVIVRRQNAIARALTKF